MSEILRRIEPLTEKQKLGLITLITLSLRENTSIYYQKKEWGYYDVPLPIVTRLDELGASEQLTIASEITAYIRDEKIAKAPHV